MKVTTIANLTTRKGIKGTEPKAINRRSKEALMSSILVMIERMKMRCKPSLPQSIQCM
jgi:hypothetical protein